MAPQPLTPSLPVHIASWFGQVVVTMVRVATPPVVPIVSSYAADDPSVAHELDEPPPPPGEAPPPPPPCGCACVIAARKQRQWTRLPMASFAGLLGKRRDVEGANSTLAKRAQELEVGRANRALAPTLRSADAGVERLRAAWG